jgi:FKBP-type peptidyl-prolyl cis-trans isomerase
MPSKTKASHRVFALTLALLFFVSSFGVTFLILWQVHQQSSANSSANTSSATNSSSTQTKSKENKVSANKLQGTKLVGFEPTSSIPELKTVDIKVGKGDAASAKSTVTVNYTGAVAATGIIFQSSLDSGQPATFPLNQVIKGWSEGIPGMKAGGVRRLLIPAALAYGANPPQGSGIPANADLVFDVTLIKIDK